MSDKPNKRYVLFVSDRTGKTAEVIGETLLSQFSGDDFLFKTYSFIRTELEANYVADEIKKNYHETGNQPIVFSTIVNDEIEKIIVNTNACVISIFSTFISPLEKSLNLKSSHTIGKPHESFYDASYKKHMDAIDFSIKNDDGKRIDLYEEADVILIGVSRCAKTPTCLYLAMNYSIKAANYPLTTDDFEQKELPGFLLPYAEKIIGLTIQPEQLQLIRTRRRPNTKYASFEQCRYEINLAEKIMKQQEIYMFDSTAMSIEEIAVNILKKKKLLMS